MLAEALQAPTSKKGGTHADRLQVFNAIGRDGWEEVLHQRYEVSAGKARVAKDLVDIERVEEKENERKALEQTALAEFLASQGIQAAPAAEAPAAVKEIGPKEG